MLVGADPQPAAIPEQNLHAVARAVGKHKPMARERVLLQHGLREREEAVETPAQIHRRDRHKHARGGGHVQHARKSSLSNGAETSRASRNVEPSSRTSSATGSSFLPDTGGIVMVCERIVFGRHFGCFVVCSRRRTPRKAGCARVVSRQRRFHLKQAAKNSRRRQS